MQEPFAQLIECTFSSAERTVIYRLIRSPQHVRHFASDPIPTDTVIYAWVFPKNSTSAEHEKPPDGALGEVLTASSTIMWGEGSANSSPLPG